MNHRNNKIKRIEDISNSLKRPNQNQKENRENKFKTIARINKPLMNEINFQNNALLVKIKEIKSKNIQ